MKKLLLILLCLPLIFACGEKEKRILIDELTNKGLESPLMYSESGLFNGVAFDIYSDGQLKEESNWTEGKLEGLHRAWYENGQLEKETNWKSGKEEGLHKFWCANGYIRYEGYYLYGERNGVGKSYYQNGQISKKSNYIDNKLEGESKEWRYVSSLGIYDGITDNLALQESSKNYKNNKMISEDWYISSRLFAIGIDWEGLDGQTDTSYLNKKEICYNQTYKKWIYCDDFK